MTEARAFLAVADHDRYAVAFWLALFGGLREGEILGLRWDDVNWIAGTISVRQILTIADGTTQFGPPKTARAAAPSR